MFISLCIPLLLHPPSAPMPQEFKKELARPKGVANRNGGMEWIRAHATEGVLYFADDDNTYDIQIFEEVCWYLLESSGGSVLLYMVVVLK